MTINTKLNLYDYIAVVEEIAFGFFSESDEYRPHYGRLNAMRVFYNLCVKESSHDETVPHDFVDLSMLETIVDDDEFIVEYRKAIVFDEYDLSFGSAYADAIRIVHEKNRSNGTILGKILKYLQGISNDMSSVDINEVAKAINGANVDKLIEAYKDSNRFKEVVTEPHDEAGSDVNGEDNI